MKRKSIPWWEPTIGTHEAQLVLEVLQSNYINEGEVTTKFENEIARLYGVKHAIAMSSGTTSIFASLAALDIGPGDEVIVPNLTFIATANAVSLTGAVPRLVDVDRETLTISPAAIREAINDRTKAIVPVHVSGRAADMTSILKIAAEFGLEVVEDAAETFLSLDNGRYLGTFGKAGCLSFSPNKILTTGQGGMILTNDDPFSVAVREIKDQGRPVRGTGGDDIHYRVGFNFKMTNLQAAVGLGQLVSVNERIRRLRKNHELYLAALGDRKEIRLPKFNLAGGAVPLWTDAICEDRDALTFFLKQRQVNCRNFWFPLNTQAPYRADDSKFSHSTFCGQNGLWLPSAYTLSDEDIEYVSDSIKEFYQTSAHRFSLKKTQQKRLTILLPVRNEGVNLPIMLRMLKATVDVDHELLVVVDSEDDDSIPVVQKLQAQYDHLHLVFNTLGRGVINAIRAGVREAHGDYVLVFAADEVGPVLAIDKMLALMDKGCQFVSCTRYGKGGKRLGGSFIGGILSRVANSMFQLLSGALLTDCTTGVKMFRREVFSDFKLESRPVGWAVAFEMGIKAHLLGLKLGEVPIVSIDRLYGGKSTFRLGPWTREYLRWFLWGALRVRFSRSQPLLLQSATRTP